MRQDCGPICSTFEALVVQCAMSFVVEGIGPSLRTLAAGIAVFGASH